MERAAARARSAAVVLAALAFPSLLTWAYFVVLAGQPASRVVYAIGKLIQFALPLVAIGLRAAPTGPSWPRRRGVALGLASGGGILALMLGLYRALRHDPLLAGASELVHGKLGDFGLDSPAGMIGVGLFYALGHSLLEEYYWRWFAFGVLRGLLAQTPAIAIASLGFMAHHVILLAAFLGAGSALTWIASLAVAAGGAWWCWLYHRSGSLAGPWISHALVDAAIMAIGYDLAFRG